jgi:hypothetical protein
MKALLLACGLFLAGCSEDSPLFSGGDLPEPQVRTRYDHDLAAREAVFSVSAGRLPFGLQLEPDGRLHGVPVAVQHADFAVTATSESKTETREFSLTATDAQGMRLLVEELPVAQPGQAYSHQLSASGGDPFDWSIVRGRTFFQGAGDPQEPLPNDDQAPAWLTLDPGTGVLSGTPDNQEVVILLLIEASDGSTSAQETYALRVGDPSQNGWLFQKSEGYVSRLLEVHVPSGLHLAREADGCYSNYGDSCCWTGTAMGGLAFRAAVLQTDAAAEKVSLLLEGLRTLRLITGVAGLPGRAYEHRENIDGACGQWHLRPGENDSHYEGTGEYAGYRLWTETSRDQFTGNIWGHAVVCEVLPQRSDLRALAAENIAAMASHVWDNQMKIVDLDGLVTSYGTMSGYGFDGLDPYELGTQLENGMNAAMLLNWFQLASQLAPDAGTRQAFKNRLDDLIADRRNPAEGRDFEHSYLDLLEKNYAYSAYPAGVDYFTETSWYNVHMAFSTFFHLGRRAEDPELRRRTLEAFRAVLWEDAEPMASGCEKPEKRRARREWNPHYSWQYLAALGDRDAESIFECLSMLMWFADPPRRDYRVENPLGLETVPGHPDFACEAVPIHLRPPSSNYIWHREPYRHTGGQDTPGREDGGGDGFVPYWMGRYFGFVPSNI